MAKDYADSMLNLAGFLSCEIQSSQRYRRFTSLLLVSDVTPAEYAQGKQIVRSSDVSFQIPLGCAWILPETPKSGALVAANRLKEHLGCPPGSWCIGVASFPDDGVSASELLTAAERRLSASRKTTGTEIVADD